MSFILSEHPHRRLNALTGEWVQVSPHRAKRPWQGQVEAVPASEHVSYDAECYLCPGNVRSNGEKNPQYTGTYVFVNDFGALMNNTPDGNLEEHSLLVAKSEPGICKVVCFSPDHSLTIPEMPVETIAGVIRQWMQETKTLAADPMIGYVQVFENKGAIMGCSNPHPHGQIWAQQSVPVEPEKKHKMQTAYFGKHGRTLLTDYLAVELERGERIIWQNEHFAALVPFWATWPFETMIIPKRAMQSITQMTAEEVNAFAEVYKVVTVKYDNLFLTSFPYSAGVHQAPTDGEAHPAWHWHMSFYPPLLRSASVKKFMVGYEMLANPQRDLTPEVSADRLRSLPTEHYKIAQLV